MVLELFGDGRCCVCRSRENEDVEEGVIVLRVAAVEGKNIEPSSMCRRRVKVSLRKERE